MLEIIHFKYECADESIFRIYFKIILTGDTSFKNYEVEDKFDIEGMPVYLITRFSSHNSHNVKVKNLSIKHCGKYTLDVCVNVDYNIFPYHIAYIDNEIEFSCVVGNDKYTTSDFKKVLRKITNKNNSIFDMPFISEKCLALELYEADLSRIRAHNREKSAMYKAFYGGTFSPK